MSQFHEKLQIINVYLIIIDGFAKAILIRFVKSVEVTAKMESATWMHLTRKTFKKMRAKKE